jgi:hypothetical protein
MRNVIAVAAVLAFAGCRQDQQVEPETPQEPLGREVRVIFRPTWNSADFDKNNIYLSAANERVMIQQVKFYMSGSTLLGDSGAAMVSEAELLDLTDGPQERMMRVPFGSYDSLRYGLGLPYDLNHQDITQVVPPSPLDFSQGMYWTWATMYRFMIFEGRFDTDPEATSTPPYQFSLHTGHDECYRERVIPLAVDITVNDTTGIILNVDIARFFTDGTDVLDLSQGSQSHGEPQNLPQAMRLSDLAVKAINAD